MLSIHVRVQNFQSIEDAQVLVEGLTVVTGPNNSGKTALMRAVRGVFTNPAAGPLVRHGAAHLSVTLSFDDGTVICWEKGWEKPGRKGKAINQYRINGLLIQGVGRGVPPEVEALGVRSIPASSEKVWPQIADQFDGTLFLLNRPGAAVAEALSDVEKVGKLTDALKLSERDGRASESEVKVRRADLDALKLEALRFKGLTEVASSVRSLKTKRAGVVEAFDKTQAARALYERLRGARSSAEALAGFSVRVPNVGNPQSLTADISVAKALKARLQKARKDAAVYTSAPTLNFPDPARAQKIGALIQTILELKKRRSEVKAQIKTLQLNLVSTTEDLEDVVIEVKQTLEALGVCPTCDTVHGRSQVHA